MIIQTKLYSYLRFSSKKQEKGDSIRRQTEAARSYAKEQGYDYQDKSFADLGVSGYRAKTRNGLETMLKAIEEKKIAEGSVIYIEMMDRLSRKGFDDTYSLISEIVNAGIILHVGSENLTLNKKKLNDSLSIIRVAVMADTAHRESAQKSKRLLATHADKRKQAVEGEKLRKVCPWWISYDEQAKDFYLNDNAIVVQEIIELRREGYSDNKLTRHLNDKGYKAPRADKWNHATIRKFLREPAIYGGYQTMTSVRADEDDATTSKTIKSELILDHYPALITFDEYQLLNPTKTKKKTKSVNNHFRGLLRCKCGGTMGKKVQRTKLKDSVKEYSYFYCSDANRGGDCDQVNVKDLDLIIFKMTEKLKVLVPKKDNEQAKVEAEIRAKQHTLNELQNAILAGGNVLALIETSKKIEAEITELNNHIKESVVHTKDDFNKLNALINNHVAWNNLAQRMIKSITVNHKSNGKQGKNRKSTLRVKLLQTNGHQVNYSIVNGRGFYSDTEKVEDLLESDTYEEFDSNYQR